MDETTATEPVIVRLWQDRQGESSLALYIGGGEVTVYATAMDTAVRVVKDDFGHYVDAATHNAQVALAWVLEQLAHDLSTGRLVLRKDAEP